MLNDTFIIIVVVVVELGIRNFPLGRNTQSMYIYLKQKFVNLSLTQSTTTTTQTIKHHTNLVECMHA